MAAPSWPVPQPTSSTRPPNGSSDLTRLVRLLM
jgi:hypothetical protein